MGDVFPPQLTRSLGSSSSGMRGEASSGCKIFSRENASDSRNYHHIIMTIFVQERSVQIVAGAK